MFDFQIYCFESRPFGFLLPFWLTGGPEPKIQYTMYNATEISFSCKCFDQWQHRLAMLTAMLYCDWLKGIQKDKLCITLACWSTRRKSNGLEIIIRSYSTDKRTDDWSRDSGLWTVVLSGLWNKRVWATFEARFFTFSRSNFFLLFLLKHYKVHIFWEGQKNW